MFKIGRLSILIFVAVLLIYSPVFAQETESTIDQNTIKTDIRNDLILFGFVSEKPTSTRLLVETQDGQKALNLKIYQTSFPNEDPNEAYTLKFNHYFLLKGLKPKTNYKISVVIPPSKIENLQLDITTSNNPTAKGVLNSSKIDITDEEPTGYYDYMYHGSHEFITSTVDFCREYGLDMELCRLADEAKMEIGGSSNENTVVTGNAVTTITNQSKLLDKLINNKYVFYGDIILLVLLLFLEIYHLLVSQSSFGITFDSHSKKSLGGVIVRIFSEQANKLLETKVTDNEGKYTFLVKPGDYYLEAAKDGYRFPSKVLTKKEDEFYSNIYRGEILHIFKKNALLSPNIALDKTSTDTVAEDTPKSNIIKKIGLFIIRKLRIMILFVATLVNLGVILIAYMQPQIVIIILIAITWLLEGFVLFRKGYR